jgi:hypothetical protein
MSEEVWSIPDDDIFLCLIAKLDMHEFTCIQVEFVMRWFGGYWPAEGHGLLSIPIWTIVI